MASKVAGELYESITGQLFEVGRQLRQPNGYPFNPNQLKQALQKVIEGKFDGTSTATQSKPVEHGVLKAHGSATVGPLKKKFDPKEFFQNRTGLYLWDSFSNRILPNTTVQKPTGKVKLTSFDLTRNAYDCEIKAELSAKHEVELWHIGKLIEGQPDGKDGPLLNNGYANIFYVGGLVVFVYWHAGSAKWHVRDWRLDVGFWDAGRRVFSRN